MRIAMRKILPLLLLTTLVWTVSCKKEDFDGPPSGGQDPNIVVNMTIAELKDKYRDTIMNNGVVVEITDDWNIAGTVIADDKSGNFYKSIVIDDGTAGISIRIDRSDYFREFPIGRRIFIKLRNLVIGEYGAMLQIGGYIDLTDPTQPEAATIPNTLIDSYVFPGVSSLPVIPTTVTLNDLVNDMDFYQNRLVKLEDVEFQISDTGSTYADSENQLYGELFVTTCSGEVIMVRSSGYATFANENVPDLNGTITAVFTEYNGTPQLLIRDTYDVDFTAVRCTGVAPPPGSPIFEDFSTTSDNVDISLAGWYNINVAGNRVWRGEAFQTEKFAQATAFSSGLPLMETWLITPEFDLTEIDTLSFISAFAFFEHNGLSVWISTDFNGSNMATANWTQLSCTLAVQADGDYTWVPSGNVSLNSLSGSAHVGFKYVGDGTTNTTNWRIDDVSIH